MCVCVCVLLVGRFGAHGLIKPNLQIRIRSSKIMGTENKTLDILHNIGDKTQPYLICVNFQFGKFHDSNELNAQSRSRS